MSRRLLLSLAMLHLAACATTSQARLAGTGPDIHELDVDGVTVIVQRIARADFTAGQLFVRGGCRNWDAHTAGLEHLALSVATSGGTESLDKDAFAHRLARLGSTITFSTGADFGSMSVKAPTAVWDDAFPLLADTLLHPALPPDEIELQRQRQLSLLRHEQESPDDRLRLAQLHQVFQGHPFENRDVGTIENVQRFQRADLQAHLALLRERKRLLLVVVGDVDAAHVAEQVHRALGGLPEGTYVEQPMPPVSFEHAALQGDPMPIPTNYIRAAAPSARWADADFIPALVAMNVLDYRVFEEVRTKRNLSYAPSARLRSEQSVPMAFLYVTAVEPTKTLQVMLDEVKRLQTVALDEKTLEGAKSTFLTEFLMRADTVDGRAAMLGTIHLLSGSWKLALDLPQRVHGVTATQVQAYAERLRHFQTSIVGDPGKLDASILP